MEYEGKGQIEEYGSSGIVEEATSSGIIEETKSKGVKEELASTSKVSEEIFYYNGSSFGDESYTDLRGQYFA